MMAFLAIAGNAVWGQTYGTQESPVEINISFMYNSSAAAPTGDGFTAIRGNETGDNPYSNTLDITAGGYYKLIGTESNIQITVSATNPVHITFASGIHVDASLDNTVDTPSRVSGDGHIGSGVWSDRCAMVIVAGAHVTLDWEGNVELSSGGDRAGINVKPEATLVLKGTHSGTLTGTSWNNQNNIYTSGAGIGGDSVDPNFGTIIIESGTVVGRCFAQVSNWRAYGAGIGGGFKVTDGSQTPAKGTSSKEGTIIIKGGNVTGTTNYSGGSNVDPTTGISAAIGGSYAGTCTNIAILGGTVNATTGNEADAIGVGEDYNGGITKGIVIGKWDEKANAPTINVSEDKINRNKKNIVWGEKGSLVGTVTMPAGTQMYTEQTVASADPNEKFYSYRLNLSNSSIDDSEDGNHQSTFYEATKNIGNYYLGAKRPFDLPKLSCDKNHIFMGWITDATFVALNNGKCSMVTPETDATKMDESLMYSPVWVDNDKNILVVSGTNWDEKDTPEISVVPDNALNKLAFSFKDAISDEELVGITFNGNKLSGTPTLQGGNTYFSKDITATVKWNTGNITSEQDITLHIAIVNEVLINTVVINSANNPHIYNGQHHNGYAPNEDDHSLVVRMEKTSDGTALNPEDENLTDGVGYRIYSFTVTNGNESNNQKASDTDEEPLPIINAGTYSNITIQALNATFGEEFDGQIKDNSLYNVSST